MPPVRRHIDPTVIAGWLVRIVAQDADRPDEVLARVTGTTRAQITAARTAAIDSGARVRDRGGARLARASAPAGSTNATGPAWRYKAG
jgi:hypothetical protein